MKTFAYRGYTTAGAVRKGYVEALSPKRAREKLSQDGILAEKLSPSGHGGERMGSDVRALIYRESASFLRAGMPLVTGLEILIESPELLGAAGALAAVRDHVREGLSFADALATVASVSGFEHALIRVGEHTGDLGAVLVQLADFMEERTRLKNRIQTALIYPAIILTMSICIAIVMLGLLLPRTKSLMALPDSAMPWLTRFMVGLGEAVFPWGILLLVTVGGLIAMVVRYAMQNDSLRCRFDRRLFGLPVIGRGRTVLVNLRFARALAVLLEGGVNLVEGVSLAGGATGSAWCRALLAKEATAVEHGDSLSAAVRRVPPLASSLPGWISVGEASGNLAALLQSAAARYQEQWERFLTRSLALLEPVLIFLIGGFVLLITLSVLLPLFAMTKAVTG